ncbi:Methyltransferase domain-containing protein [Belliella buryatensis]|uniref:Methyltransferase domain-containing protein n=1 Tax=Belliella buryatensis TaxID=1500549 RepID=A0A239C6F9_9BACT|nr:methyltransferase domain-containing protein [Belliella buryatensis]SNS15806.1 Methyltransferase domain-containing protein [Belliella buryatensis]
MKRLLSVLMIGILATVTYGQEIKSDFFDLVPYVTTPKDVVDAIMKLGDVSQNDVVYDLGSGDGRIPIEAARRFGTKGFGIEIDAELVAESKALAKEAGVSHLVSFIQGDLFELELSEATVLVIYLFPDINLKLRPKLQKLSPGTKIITHNYDMGDWKPDQHLEVMGDDGKVHKLFLWVIPETK